MAIKYLSQHDSPDDPGGLIKQALDMGPEFPGPAEDIMMAWMLRLAEGSDPAAAAGRLLEAYAIASGPLPPGPCGRIVELLRQTAGCPQEHLARPPGRRKGRGRRER